jgi:hypothetical protein
MTPFIPWSTIKWHFAQTTSALAKLICLFSSSLPIHICLAACCDENCSEQDHITFFTAFSFCDLLAIMYSHDRLVLFDFSFRARRLTPLRLPRLPLPPRLRSAVAVVHAAVAAARVAVRAVALLLLAMAPTRAVSVVAVAVALLLLLPVSRPRLPSRLRMLSWSAMASVARAAVAAVALPAGSLLDVHLHLNGRVLVIS